MTVVSGCGNAFVEQTGLFLQALRLQPTHATTVDSPGRKGAILITIGDVLGVLYAGDFD